MKPWIFFSFLTTLLFAIPAPGQEPDSLLMIADSLAQITPPDSAAVREGFFKKNYPDPKKAGLLSLVFPGAGQAYNKRWWKLPLVFGAMGGMIYLIDYNTTEYKRFQTAYQLELKGEEHEFSGTSFDNAQTLRTIRDGYDKNKQLSYIGLVAVYLLQGVEAFVDAHLKTFDISDDLSLQLRPEIGIDAFTGQAAVGFGIRIPLQPAQPSPPRP